MRKNVILYNISICQMVPRGEIYPTLITFSIFPYNAKLRQIFSSAKHIYQYTPPPGGLKTSATSGVSVFSFKLVFVVEGCLTLTPLRFVSWTCTSPLKMATIVKIKLTFIPS